MGYKVDCYLEGDTRNPLDPFDRKYPPKIPIEVFFETYKQCWQTFMGNDLDIAIVEYLSDLLTIIRLLNPIGKIERE